MTGDSKPYVEFYDGETRDLVARRYEEEITRYGFEFSE